MVYFLCKAYDSDRQNCYFALSLPVRGAWIEIKINLAFRCRRQSSLPVRGAWIEILSGDDNLRSVYDGRSPCGERGLKSSNSLLAYAVTVAPRAGSVD